MEARSKLKGLNTSFYVIGEASRANLAYVEPEYSATVYPLLKHVGFEERCIKGALVHEIINALGSPGSIITMQRIFETLFIDMKNRNVVFHLKPERHYGYVMNYLDIRIAQPYPTGKQFTWENYKDLNQISPVFLLTDYDELDLPEKNIPRIIQEAPGPVYVSTRKRNLSVFEGAKAVIISERDYKNAYSEVSNLIVTLAGDGATFKDTIYKTEKHTSGDNLGCRETFFAVFSYAHYFTQDYDFAINIANQAASSVAKVRSLPVVDVHFFRDLGKKTLEHSVKK